MAPSNIWGCVLVLLCSGALLPVSADTATYTRSDITGNEINCGQGQPRCRICGDINSIESSCQSNPTCVAYSFDGSCGFLKSAAEPRTYREGFTTFVLTDKGSSGGSTPAPSPPSAQSPAPAPAPAPAPDTTQVNAATAPPPPVLPAQTASSPPSVAAPTPPATPASAPPSGAPAPYPQAPAGPIQVSNPVQSDVSSDGTTAETGRPLSGLAGAFLPGSGFGFIPGRRMFGWQH